MVFVVAEECDVFQDEGVVGLGIDHALAASGIEADGFVVGDAVAESFDLSAFSSKSCDVMARQANSSTSCSLEKILRFLQSLETKPTGLWKGSMSWTAFSQSAAFIFSGFSCASCSVMMSSLGLIKDKTNKDNHKMAERQMKRRDLLTCDAKTGG